MARTGRGWQRPTLAKPDSVPCPLVQEHVVAISHNELEVFGLVGRMTTDPAFAVFAFERGRSPEQPCDPLAVAGDDWVEEIADGWTRAEVMVLGEKLIEARRLGGGNDVALKFRRGRGGRATRRECLRFIFCARVFASSLPS